LPPAAQQSRRSSLARQSAALARSPSSRSSSTGGRGDGHVRHHSTATAQRPATMGMNSSDVPRARSPRHSANSSSRWRSGGDHVPVGVIVRPGPRPETRSPASRPSCNRRVMRRFLVGGDPAGASGPMTTRRSAECRHEPGVAQAAVECAEIVAVDFQSQARRPQRVERHPLDRPAWHQVVAVGGSWRGAMRSRSCRRARWSPVRGEGEGAIQKPEHRSGCARR